MFLGGAFTLDGMSAVWDEFVATSARASPSAAVYAVLFGSIALLVASLAGRRAVAAALIVGVFLITTPVYGVLQGIAYPQTAGRRPSSPAATAATCPSSPAWSARSPWSAGRRPVVVRRPRRPMHRPVRPALRRASRSGSSSLCVLLLLLRYRKVAR